MSTIFDIKSICHINTNEDGDRFVGVKVVDDKAIVYFPLGYELPSDEKLIRRDIRHLFSVLSAFGNKEDKMLKGQKFVQAHPVDFPIQAFLDVLDYFMENNGNYYKETEKKTKTASMGKINFKSTVRHQKALIVNNNIIFSKFDVDVLSPLDNQLITQIHKYCVYEAFQRLGWLYSNQEIPNPGVKLEKKVFLQELQRKSSETNQDRNRRLFKSMKAMIEFIDDRVLDRSFFFGTDNFEYVWEKLIDKVFGEPNKNDYFPKALWVERHGAGAGIPTHALMPDTIMIYTDSKGNEKVCILDAKYYRYGVTHKTEHLPESTSINKQITYGEYAERKCKLSNECLFNAFLMPYNMNDNLFETNEKFVNVAESYGEWRENKKNYEKIQGILIDVRYLMMNYLGNHDKDKENLANIIEQYLIS